MITRNKGKWDARTYDQVSRLVQYRWGIQVLKWRKWRGDEIVMDAGRGSVRLPIASVFIESNKDCIYGKELVQKDS